MRSALPASLTVIALTISAAVYAQVQQWGSWSTGRMQGNQGLFAATYNDSGNILGQYCLTSESSCVYLLGLRTGCVQNSRYPILVNSDAGAEALEVLCGGHLASIGRHQYIFTDFDRIDALVKKAWRMGFAVALRGDEFTVVRFDLNGSNEAIAAMRAAANAQSAPVGRGTRDQRL